VCLRYGLGIIYYRQEKYALAEYHFTRALSINGQSSVLHCYLGMVLQVRDTIMTFLGPRPGTQTYSTRRERVLWIRAFSCVGCVGG
jgi:hypothetical protein